MTHIEEQTQYLVELTGRFIFPEYYSHTDAMMWKIINPFTNYAEDKIVLCEVNRPDGLQAAIQIAITTLSIQKEKFYS